MKKSCAKSLKASILIFLTLTLLQCANKSLSVAAMPNELLGLSVGMSEEAAKERLSEIAEFERIAEKRQQLWRLKNDARFSELAIGFDKENRVRYITAFVDKEKARETIKFSEVGKLKEAKQEVTPPHYRYTWQVAESGDLPAHFVSIYGDNPETLTMYSLSKVYTPSAAKQGEEEEEEDE